MAPDATRRLSIAKNKDLFMLNIVTVDHGFIAKVRNDKHADTVWFGYTV